MLASLAELVDAAVADVCHVGLVGREHGDGRRRTHAAQGGRGRGAAVDGVVGAADGLAECLAVELFGGEGAEVAHDFVRGERRGRLAAVHAAHAVAHGEDDAVAHGGSVEGVLVFIASADTRAAEGVAERRDGQLDNGFEALFV